MAPALRVSALLLCAEVAEKKVARKPKDHTFSIQRYWRSHGNKAVMALVVLALLFILLISSSTNNAEKLAKQVEAERKEVTAEQAQQAQQAKLRRVPPSSSLNPGTQSHTSRMNATCAVRHARQQVLPREHISS